MSEPLLVHLGTGDIATYIHGAQRRVALCMPGLTQAVAAAVVNVSKKLGRAAVTVVLDVDDRVARHGYGEFDALTLLMESGVDVRTEGGLRTCLLIADGKGYSFFAPPMLVETQDEESVGVNAMRLLPDQVEAVVRAVGAPAQDEPSDGPSPVPPKRPEQPDKLPAAGGSDQGVPPTNAKSVPEVGVSPVTPQKLEAVRAALELNPPQKFDLARKVNVFNAYIEFVEIRLIGLHVGRYTVQLPKGLGLALQDDATARRLLTTFKLVSEDSKVAKEAVAIDKKVRQLREVYTRSLGEGLGSVMLRSKRAGLEKAIGTLKDEISVFQAKVVERLDREIALSRKNLVDGLWQAVKRAKPQELEAQVSGPITSELAKRYVDMELAQVFPDAKSLISEMRLEFIVKGVTYEVLKSLDFQDKVRKAFPLDSFDKPFTEFQAAPSIQPSLFAFGGRS